MHRGKRYFFAQNLDLKKKQTCEILINDICMGIANILVKEMLSQTFKMCQIREVLI